MKSNTKIKLNVIFCHVYFLRCLLYRKMVVLSLPVLRRYTLFHIAETTPILPHHHEHVQVQKEHTQTQIQHWRDDDFVLCGECMLLCFFVLLLLS